MNRVRINIFNRAKRYNETIECVTALLCLRGAAEKLHQAYRDKY